MLLGVPHMTCVLAGGSHHKLPDCATIASQHAIWRLIWSGCYNLRYGMDCFALPKTTLCDPCCLVLLQQHCRMLNTVALGACFAASSY